MFKLIIDNKVAMWVKEVIELEKEEAVEEP
jgi:hypothetical protein